MFNREKTASSVRRIVSVDSPEQMPSLREALALSGGRIIKELPLVNGYLCEFSGDAAIDLAVRDEEFKINIEEDLEFKLCVNTNYSFWPQFISLFWPLLPYPQTPQKSPIPPKTAVPKKTLQDGQLADWGLKRIGAPLVWDKLKERRIRVGILDTGINTKHPEIKANIIEGISTIDDIPSYEDDYGHGTHIAGTIMGINPYVDIYVVKAFNKSGKGKLADIIEGIDWLIRRQVNVINMSFSTSESNSTFVRVIQAAYSRGIVLVAAAGNDAGPVNYPAKYLEVVAVSATDYQDRIAKFSCYGPEIDFCAPGVDIRSVWLNSGYAVKSGTSFAAPHITGAVADVLNYYGSMTPQQVSALMSESTTELSGLNSEQQGAGMIDLSRLID
jgi:subtilisin family serine protease